MSRNLRDYTHTKKFIYTMTNNNDIKFNEWLAGLIDGDGSFTLTQGKFINCEITVGIEDAKMLYQIQNKFGGSIKLRAGVKAIRYRLQNQADIIKLIHAVNGNIRNSKRIVQFYRACDILGITPLSTLPLTSSNAWISGFFDSNGTIHYNLIPPFNTPQLIISISNRYLCDIEILKPILGGNISFDKAQNGYFKWILINESDHLRFFQYNKICPSRSFKVQRIFLIQEFYKFYHLKAYINNPLDPILYKAWLDFDRRWNRKNLTL